MNNRIFSLLDLETTGGSPKEHAILEIGVIQLLQGKILNTYEQLLNPERHISPFISDLTGITEYMVKNAPTFEEIAPQLATMLEGTIIVAHNASFDYQFLRSSFRRVGIHFHEDVLCSVKLSRALFPELPKHGLDSLIEHFDMQLESRHRAMSDTKALYFLFQEIEKHHSQEIIEETIQKLMRVHIFPAHIQDTSFRSLPTTSGVYLCMNKDNVPLSIHHDTSIQEGMFGLCAKAHDSTSLQKVFEDTHNIVSIETSTWTAPLLASLLKQQHKPHFHTKEEKSLFYTALTLTREPPFFRIEKVTPDNVLEQLRTTNCALFSSLISQEKKIRELAQTFQLCHKILGLETSPGPCYASTLGNCALCTKKESADAHNTRLLSAFSTIQIAHWPYDGPIRCTDTSSPKYYSFLIDQWTVLSYDYTHDGKRRRVTCPGRFHREIYGILQKTLPYPPEEIHVEPEMHTQDNTLPITLS